MLNLMQNLKVNMNVETGIRYGIVSMHSLDCEIQSELFDKAMDAYYDWFVENYPEESQNEDLEIDCETISGTSIEHEGLELVYRWDSICVCKSKKTVKVNLCSTCVPNAGDLSSPDKNGFEAYTIPKDWYVQE